MANYSLVINSKFRPFEYQELLAPALMDTQAHQAVEEAYADLSTKANIWDKMINEATDPNTHNLYKKYANDLQSYSDQLAQNGLTPTSRQAMLNMRNRYAREIVPIENAYKKREEEIKRQQDIIDKTGGNVVFTRNARATSLDKYLSGTLEDYGQVNLDDVLKYGIAGGKAISERYIRTSEGRAFNNEYYNLITEKGFTPEEAIQALRDPSKYPELERFINDELERRGAVSGRSLYDDISRNRIESALIEGINLGIGYDKKNDLREDWRSRAILSADLSDRNAKRQAEREIEKAAAIAKIKKAQQDEEEMNSLFNQKVLEGASGERNENLERLQGLRTSVENGVRGVSTNRRDQLKKEYDKALEAWNKLSEEEKVRQTNYVPVNTSTPAGVGSYSMLGKVMSNSGSHKPIEYENLKKAKAALDAENEWLNSKAQEYRVYDPSSMENAFNIGTTLERNQSMTQNYSYGLNLDSSSYTNLKGGFQKLITLGRGNVGLSKEGKMIDKDKAIDILGEEDTAIGVSSDKNGIYLSATDKDNNRYKIGGTQAIDSFNDKLTTANNFLKDFSAKSLEESTITLSSVDFDRLALGDLRVLPASTEIKRVGDIGGIVVRNMNGDALKIALDGNQIMGISTLSDELGNQGRHRYAAIEHIAKQALNELLPKVAHTPRSTEGEK